MNNNKLRTEVSRIKLKFLRLAESNKWKVLNKDLILNKTSQAREIVIALKEENLKITRKLDLLDGILYRLYYRNSTNSMINHEKSHSGGSDL